MNERLTLELHNRQQAWVLIQSQLYPFLKAVMQGGGRWLLTVSRMKRTSKQNRRYWGRGVLAQIAEQATVNGRLYSADVWHELMKKKFIGLVELPDGSVIGQSSRDLSTTQFSEFCSQVEAYAATELGVVFYDLPNE